VLFALSRGSRRPGRLAYGPARDGAAPTRFDQRTARRQRSREGHRAGSPGARARHVSAYQLLTHLFPARPVPCVSTCARPAACLSLSVYARACVCACVRACACALRGGRCASGTWARRKASSRLVWASPTWRFAQTWRTSTLCKCFYFIFQTSVPFSFLKFISTVWVFVPVQNGVSPDLENITSVQAFFFFAFPPRA
jgi:hypothetical protein